MDPVRVQLVRVNLSASLTVVRSSAMLHHIVAVILVGIASSDAFQALGKYSHWGRCSPLRMSHGSNAVKTSLRIATG
jgi:hypothetical protein